LTPIKSLLIISAQPSLIQQCFREPSHLTLAPFDELSTPTASVMKGLYHGQDLAARPVSSVPCQVVTAWKFAPARELAAFGALRRQVPSASSRSSLPAPSGHVPSLPLVAALLLDPAPPPETPSGRHGDRRRTSLPPVTRAGPSAVGSFSLSRRLAFKSSSGRPRRDAPRQLEPSPPATVSG
jgi:hypothetical protein